jgi:predicted SnoaL-like aldol condensation-catalyzing enzyme
LCLVVVAASSACTQPPTTADQLEANKKLLLDFFASQEPRAARAERFMAEDYIQHNPRALRMDEITGARGRQAWVRAFEEAESRGARLVDLGGIALRDPVLVMAEGDLVTAIYRGTLPDPDDESRTYEAFAFETVRIKDGKFVEHWDQVTLAAGWMDGQR